MSLPFYVFRAPTNGLWHSKIVNDDIRNIFILMKINKRITYTDQLCPDYWLKAVSGSVYHKQKAIVQFMDSLHDHSKGKESGT